LREERERERHGTESEDSEGRKRTNGKEEKSKTEK
jgi:hypothetical protein